MENWDHTLKHGVQKHYTIYINSIRYLFGYYEQLNMIAESVKINMNGNVVPNEFNSSGEIHQVDANAQRSMNSKCMETATEFLDFKFDKDLVTYIVNSAVRLTNIMTQLRSSFFCTLCDGEAQEMLRKFWHNGNANVQQTLFFSKDFCSRFVQEAVDGVYNYIFYVKHYLDGMKTIIDCHLGENATKFQDAFSNLKFFLDEKYDQQGVKTCFYNKEHGIMENCQRFCGEFNMAIINKMIDGDTTQLFKFVDFLSQRKNIVFKNQENVFTEDPSYLSTLIFNEFDDLKDQYMFFVPSHQQKLLDSMKTDIVTLGGINPLESGNDNMYYVILKSTWIMSAVMTWFIASLWE